MSSLRPTGLGIKALLFYLLLVGAFLATPYSNLFFLLLVFLTVLGVCNIWWTHRNVAGLDARLEEIAPTPARVGAPLRAAVATGFNRAKLTILDANITTLLTALVLFEYGTGPIKGFAVTLSIGIVTSVFAALVITRLFFAIYPGNRHLEALSI